MNLATTSSRSPPIVWSIAGSDPCGGAGIQADLKTFTALGVHGATVVTALTAQNSFAVIKLEPVADAMLAAQLAALADDMPPRAIKIGLLPSVSTTREIARYLSAHPAYVVCDPVIAATAGLTLIESDVLQAMKDQLFPHIALLTPNISEAQALTDKPIASATDVETAARAIRGMGVKSVVIKGWREDEFAQDFYLSATGSFWLSSPWQKNGAARGTGCTLASALAAAHALGFPERDAAVIAKAYVTQALRLRQQVGKGAAILSYGPWPNLPQDLPYLTDEATHGRIRMRFPDCGPHPLGFYPIVDSFAWLKRLLPLGVTTAQLRIKTLHGDALEAEIKDAIMIARRYGCRLFINDYWQLALRHGAYGVHLGQEDLDDADLNVLCASGIRLGVSTHCYSEMARAAALRPSYIAIGPVFPTTLKSMNFAPHGVTNFATLRRMINCPVVAIGGITLATADALLEAGADSLSVVSDITQNADPEAQAQKWLRLFPCNPPIKTRSR